MIQHQRQTNVLTFMTLFVCNFGQLLVNVKNKGGDVLQENINANTSQDTVTVEFQKYDGTLISQYIDFKNEVQIFKAVILAEEERGQTQNQVVCFVCRFIKNEFISSDAMSKLRQKNQGAIRHPEEEKGEERFQEDLLIDMNQAYVISPLINKVCNEAVDSTYISDQDLKIISRTMSKDYTILIGATKRLPENAVSCKKVKELWQSCACQYQICVGWYPCGLKYCKGKDSSGKVVSYRCGIKTCSKCRVFDYYVSQKQNCMWDEEKYVVDFREIGKPEVNRENDVL